MSPIDYYKTGVDRTLLIENLRLTPQQRFDKFDCFMQSLMELRAAGEAHRKTSRSLPSLEHEQGNVQSEQDG